MVKVIEINLEEVYSVEPKLSREKVDEYINDITDSIIARLMKDFFSVHIPVRKWRIVDTQYISTESSGG